LKDILALFSGGRDNGTEGSEGFGACPCSETAGFNLEDTHMKYPKRLSTLFGILAIAAVVAIKLGGAVHRRSPIPVKKHGRPQRSLFLPSASITCAVSLPSCPLIK
jgi:hypothetical protein